MHSLESFCLFKTQLTLNGARVNDGLPTAYVVADELIQGSCVFAVCAVDAVFQRLSLSLAEKPAAAAVCPVSPPPQSDTLAPLTPATTAPTAPP